MSTRTATLAIDGFEWQRDRNPTSTPINAPTAPHIGQIDARYANLKSLEVDGQVGEWLIPADCKSDSYRNQTNPR